MDTWWVFYGDFYMFYVRLSFTKAPHLPSSFLPLHCREKSLDLCTAKQWLESLGHKLVHTNTFSQLHSRIAYWAEIYVYSKRAIPNIRVVRSTWLLRAKPKRQGHDSGESNYVCTLSVASTNAPLFNKTFTIVVSPNCAA